MNKVEIQDIEAITPHQALELLGTSKKGLASKEIAGRLAKYGANTLGEIKKKSALLMFLNNFKSPLIYILLIASVVTLFMGKILDSGVIFLVTLVNATIGFFQEQKAELALEALRKMTRLSSVAIRDGKRVNLKSEQLVPGDIVVLEEGDKVPADGRLIESSDLMVNEAVLTGESLAAKKNAEAFVAKEAGEEPTNLVFMGTTVISGRALMVVAGTGTNTEFGKISKLVESESEAVAPLQRKMADFSRKLGIVIIVFCIIIFFLGIVTGRDAVTMFELSISMAVSAIPEGLPVAITVVLVIGVKRMTKHKAILRNIAAVETLGTTTVIASDKTGTITHNKLTVTKVYTDKVYRVSGEGHGFKGDFWDEDVKIEPKKHLLQLLDCGVIVNNGKLETKNTRTEVFGDPTDCAILVAAKKAGITREESSDFVVRLAEIPFTSERKYHAVLAETSGAKAIYIKGALEEVLKRCSHSFTEATPVKMNKAREDEIKKAAKYFAERGLRVIALAYKEESQNKTTLTEKDLENNLVFIGLIGMRDTYRSGIREAIAKCKNAGIRMIMITGDHLDTARAIGYDIGILEDESEAIEANILEKSSLSEVRKIVKKVKVFARISPTAKYKIIEALKANGQIVAMTGDGVNDVPALKKADIGVAMGVMGTEAAKDASDMVLTDDNFSTIVFAVSEGRAVFSNIRKTLFYLLSTNLGEVCTVTLGLILGYPLILLPLQILWINLVTDSLTALPLGMEPAHSNQINQPPRNPKESLVSRRMLLKMGLIASVMAVGAIFIFNYAISEGVDYARTMVFSFLVLIQWFNAVNARTESSSIFRQNPFGNKSLLIGLAIAMLLQFGVLYTGFLGNVFSLTTLDLNDWLIIVPVAFVTVLASELEKLIYRLRHPKKAMV